MRASLRVTVQRLERVPRPLDAPVAEVPGPDLDRILLLGDGPAIGYGVSSHGLALPGQLARQVSAATGRGASVRFSGHEQMGASGMKRRLLDEDLSGLATVLVMVGTVDAACLTPLRDWSRSVDSFLGAALEASPSRLQFVVVGIPPLDRLPLLRGVRRRLASPHAHAMNRATAALTAGYGPRVQFLPFFPQGVTDRGRYRSPASYESWARSLCPGTVAALDRSRDGSRPG